jgi:hypothetical protein
VHEPVKRGEQGDPVADRLVAHVGVCPPLPLLERDAERAEPLRLEFALGLPQGHRGGCRIPALGQIPHPLAAAAPDHGDLAVHVQRLEHAADVAVAVPAMLAPAVDRPVLELA